MTIKSKEAKNVLLLPCSAVSGSFQSGEVFAVINKEVVAKEVKLGINNGSFIEITSGLGEGDIVPSRSPKDWSMVASILVAKELSKSIIHKKEVI